MISPGPALPGLDDPGTRRADVLFTVTAALTLAVTGIGLFEGNVVYPSWYELAAFDGFADYHGVFSGLLVPWLPVPLLVATLLTAALLRWRPPAVPRGALTAVLVLQVVVVVVTAALAVPLQQQLGTSGRSPAEVVDLLDRLVLVNRLREVPGVAVALAFAWMLHRRARRRA